MGVWGRPPRGGTRRGPWRGRPPSRVIGLDRDRIHLNHAMALGLVDEAGDLPTGVAGADLVVVAVPVGAMAEVVRAAAPHLALGCIVTDVGSVKGDLVDEVEREIHPGRAYVPAHPVAGTERSGPEAAAAGLFHESLCVLTPSSRTPEEALKKVMRLWEGVGSHVVLMDPFRHDQIFALVSHLPHVVAYALLGTVLNRLSRQRLRRPFASSRSGPCPIPAP